MTAPSNPSDPTTPAEWQEAVNTAEFWLLVDSARQYGLVTGGPEVDVPRCEEILARGKTNGYVPRGEPGQLGAEAADNARIVDQMRKNPDESPHPPLDDTWMYRQEVEARRRMGGPTDEEIEDSLHVPVLDDDGNVLYSSDLPDPEGH